MKFDAYSLKARIFPAVISMLIPLFTFNYFFASVELEKFITSLSEWKAVSSVSVSLILILFLSELGRIIGKAWYQAIYFEDETAMPTTNFMLYSNNQYSSSFKDDFRCKIKADFSLVLPTEKHEHDDEIDTRKRIVESMAYVRKALKGNQFLLQHNIEYGMMRNFVGGSVVGIIISMINFLIFHLFYPNQIATMLSVVMIAIFLLVLIGSKKIIQFYGMSYAKILFQQYMGK